MIKPTVGRVVLFRPSEQDRAIMNVYGSARPRQHDPVGAEQPLLADVVYVWNDRLVNLLVTDHIGETYIRQRIALRQDGDPIPPGSYCEWRRGAVDANAEPYQTELAKKGFAD